MTEFANPILAKNTLIRRAIQSEDFLAGVSGWRIERDGDAEFNELVARGSITASSVDVQDPNGERVLIDPAAWESGQPAVFLSPDEATHEGTLFASWSDVQDAGSIRLHPPRNVNNRYVGLNIASEGNARASISTITSGTLTLDPTFNIGSEFKLNVQGVAELHDLTTAGRKLTLDSDTFQDHLELARTGAPTYEITPSTNQNLRIMENGSEIARFSGSESSIPSLVVPVAKLIATSPQTIATGTITELDMGSVEYDTDNMADLANNGLEIQTAGVYMLSPSIRWGPGSGTRIQIRAVINGINALFTSYLTPAGFNEYSASIPAVLSVGDLVTAMCFQASGGNVDTAPGDFSPGIAVTFMSAT